MITTCYRFALAVVTTLMLAATGAMAQIPANDSCAGAVTITALPFTFAELPARDRRPGRSHPPVPIPAAENGGLPIRGRDAVCRFSTVGSRPIMTWPLDCSPDRAEPQSKCRADDSIPGTLRAATLGYEVQLGVTYYLHVAEWKGGGPSGYVPTGGDLVLKVYLSTPTPLSAGPKSGSVAGGDSIILSVLGGQNIPSGVGLEPGAAGHNPPQILLPAPADVRPPKGPAGSNFTKDPTVSATAVSTAQPVVLKNFQGNTSTGFIPPDPILAVGPNHVIDGEFSFMVWIRTVLLRDPQRGIPGSATSRRRWDSVIPRSCTIISPTGGSWQGKFFGAVWLPARSPTTTIRWEPVQFGRRRPAWRLPHRQPPSTIPRSDTILLQSTSRHGNLTPGFSTRVSASLKRLSSIITTRGLSRGLISGTSANRTTPARSSTESGRRSSTVHPGSTIW